MSALFDVPCPDCDQQLRTAADGLRCRGCGHTYQLRMGHLFPSGEEEPSRLSTEGAGAGTVSTP